VTTDVVPRPAIEEPAPPPADDGRAARRWITAGVVAVVALGVALRLQSPSALWLDEAISTSLSGLPLHEVPEALRQDGSPPLYALLLWCWERLFGASPAAVRSLSAVFGVAALGVIALAGARLGGRRAGIAALLLLASSPFAVRYSTEARMYSLLALLVLCGFLALDGYLRRPGIGRGVLVGLVSGVLALTHYWALFLLATVTGVLLARAWRTRSRANLTAVGWMASGGLLFLPWLPSFRFQLAHTGTPWGVPPGFAVLLSTLEEWTGGAYTHARVLAFLVVFLAAVGAAATAVKGPRVEFDLRGRPPGRALAVVVVVTLVLGLTFGRVTGATYAARYTSVAMPLFLLLVALGVARLPRSVGTPILVVAVIAGLAGAAPLAFDASRTEAPVIAAALRSQALPGDVVVYCPDQLGPSTSRLLPDWLRQEVYPTGGSPARVDWVDYARRNRSADPVAFARQVSARTGNGVVWLVSLPGYRTYEGHCQELARALTALRGGPLEVVGADPQYFEQSGLRGWPRHGTPWPGAAPANSP
jgi:mannosyltransferase